MAQTHQDHFFPSNDQTYGDSRAPTAEGRWADPETLARLQPYPCLQCLSDKQLWIVATIVLCRILTTDPDADCTVAELTSNSGCVPCFSERQMWQILVALIAQWAVDNGYIDDVDTLIQEAVCLNCLEAKRVRGILISLLGGGLENGTLFPTRP